MNSIKQQAIKLSHIIRHLGFYTELKRDEIARLAKISPSNAYKLLNLLRNLELVEISSPPNKKPIAYRLTIKGVKVQAHVISIEECLK